MSRFFRSTFFPLFLLSSRSKKKSVEFFSSRAFFSMSEFNPTPFKGEAGVPHVPEDWFTTMFISTQVRQRKRERKRFRSFYVLLTAI